MKKWVQFRIARPTDKFEEVIQFYEEGLGLKRIGEFHNHEDYDGVTWCRISFRVYKAYKWKSMSCSNKR
ncbi:hypothetical protein BACCIP111899_00472 [Bacillus rhizoplanae]|uniref:YycE-like N-terminal domain-containing protein n=1 Tax=Bacillus rhizoplanae TaxID=2880966 RepID=A0ABM8Y6I0_9BACI|nr:hypothetical protein BACCIP111899_00472 [Bacillus rhizoplanae]